MNFEYCRLKSVNRTYKYFSLKANLYQIPVTKVTVNPALYKRFSGYRPFLYNITIDACKFLANPRTNPVIGYLHDFISGRSNINHSCPYDHDIVLDRITTDFTNHRLTKILPFPEGDYMVKVRWMAYDMTRAVFQLYFSLS
ncbi:uncharacterized protein [Drosophila takahashii]|uniref:uncharacterized protein n=1 Tax=Drosophila takahashii TaxID=29030 RepID=UPI001CF86CF0|nr:uncharacterized protein LOC108054132 [Drosophila takahashii]